MLRIIKFVLLLVALCLGIALAVHNTQNVQVDYLVGKAQYALFFLLLVGLVAGFIFGAVLGLVKTLGLRNQLRRARKRIRDLEAQNKTLNNPALKDA
jgi:uncharacterized membrane protein YciS (DUF1049 family)